MTEKDLSCGAGSGSGCSCSKCTGFLPHILSKKCLFVYGLKSRHSHYDLCGKYIYWKHINKKPVYKLNKTAKCGSIVVLYSRLDRNKKIYTNHWMFSKWSESFINETGWIQSKDPSNNPWDIKYGIWDDGRFVSNINFRCDFVDSPSIPYNIIEANENMFKQKIYTDVLFKLQDGTEVEAHKGILASRCEFFKSLFTHGKYKDTKIIPIEGEDWSTKTFKSFIEYLYTNKIKEIDIDNIVNLLILSDKYCISELKNRCENFCLNNIKLVNIIPWLLLVNRYDFPKIKEKCLEIVTENYNFKTLLCSDGFIEIIREIPDFWKDVTNKSTKKIKFIHGYSHLSISPPAE